MADPLPRRGRTHYDVLGVPRGAKLTDITRAYNNHLSRLRRDDRPPDLKGEAIFREAYETLSDPDRRDAYDASLVAPERRHRSRRRAIAVGAAGVVVAAIALWWQRPDEPAGPPPRTTAEILGEASVSVGSLTSIDLSGRITRTGLAFAIGEQVFVGSCRGLAPGAQVVVSIPPRTIPVRVLSSDDASGICRLAAEKAEARPLEVVARDVGTNELVYAARANDQGVLTLTQGRVKRVVHQPGGRLIEAPLPEDPGGPLFDAQGRVIAVATEPGKHLQVPPAWVREAREPFREEKPPAAAADPPAEKAAPAAVSPRGVPRTLDDIPPEQRRKLEKAHVPPPPDQKDDWMK